VEVVVEVVVDVDLVDVTRVVVVALVVAVVAVVVAVPGRHWPINAQKISFKTNSDRSDLYCNMHSNMCRHFLRRKSSLLSNRFHHIGPIQLAEQVKSRQQQR
jgi:hypothetical protein